VASQSEYSSLASLIAAALILLYAAYLQAGFGLEKYLKWLHFLERLLIPVVYVPSLYICC
ncbi:hypothetical protein, partial [Domibacillus tundrae]|uniref:hypothetical protein n=1 Tax=Domibacillus tundrae TaxID=1587527 RepID=UPI003392B965